LTGASQTTKRRTHPNLPTGVSWQTFNRGRGERFGVGREEANRRGESGGERDAQSGKRGEKKNSGNRAALIKGGALGITGKGGGGWSLRSGQGRLTLKDHGSA